MSILRDIVVHELEKAIREHQQCYPKGEWQAANIALGGLRNIAAFVCSETRTMGNEECVVHLKELPE